MSKRRKGLAVMLVFLVLLLVGIELGFRALQPPSTRRPLENFRRYLLTGEIRNYEPRAHTVYQARRNGFGNAFGFVDDPWTRARTPGVPRILCLGGSTTAGGNDLGIAGAYPRQLEDLLERRSGRDFEVLNAGVPGWSTAEIVVSWLLTLQDFQPDVVVLHEAVNDLPPRFLADFEADYSRWRVPIQVHAVTWPASWLASVSNLYVLWRLRAGKAPGLNEISTVSGGAPEPLLEEGKLPHETSLAFRRNVRNLVRSAHGEGCTVVLMTLPGNPAQSHGAFWTYGIAENNEHLRELAREEGTLLADAAREFDARAELQAQFIDGVHLEGPGNQVKAELLAEALAEWIAALPSEGARAPQPHSRAR
jgi:lysophospholipase L1-like esterase